MENFTLKFLWLDKTIAVSLDQKVGNKTIPLTEYYFWPTSDAWEEIKVFLEGETWILPNVSFLILNQITEVFNIWGEWSKDPSNNTYLTEVKHKFPDCFFVGIE